MTALKATTKQLRNAFAQFLSLPLMVVVAFVAVTIVVYGVDDAWSKDHTPDNYTWLGKMLGDSSSLATLLATIASSIITVTSITFSLLLIAVQQGASALTTQVTDQFLMRRNNQFYFGYFVGLSVFALLSLVTAGPFHRPLFAASIIILLTVVALCMMIVLIYNTIDQMRPTQIVRAIHHHVLEARERQSGLLAATRRQPRAGWRIVEILRSTQAGHITGIDVGRLRESVATIGCGDVEIELRVPIGRFLAYGDPLVALRTAPENVLRPDALHRIKKAVLDATRFDDSRDLRQDPAFGIRQLGVIAWTSGSTAKSNPAPSEAVAEGLRDILSRWAAQGEAPGDPTSLVVIRDAAPREAISVLENIVLVSSESIQAQTLATTIHSLAVLLEILPQPWRDDLAEVARRSLSALGEHVLTRELESAHAELAAALDSSGYAEIASNVRIATARLATTLGTLNSRSTRVASDD